MSPRALDVLRGCSYVLCEDTRHSGKLCQHYDLSVRLLSYHKFNEAAREEKVIADLLQGQSVGLISDAGTPAISDPGERLVSRCVEEGIAVCPIPGPCSVIAALTVSGFSTQPFQFIGFLSRKGSARRKELQGILNYRGTTICFESPHRVCALLKELAQWEPSCGVVIARELTKIHEEIIRGTAKQLTEDLQGRVLKGEMVLVIAPARKEGASVNPEEWIGRVRELENTGMKRSEAIRQISNQEGVSRNDLYRWMHNFIDS